jgi:hypothetical protein
MPFLQYFCAFLECPACIFMQLLTKIQKALLKAMYILPLCQKFNLEAPSIVAVKL